MATSVKLYVYDLSNGLARQLSTQFLGKQVDGIWFVSLTASVSAFKLPYCRDRHTSVVVFGKEIFYGRGICITRPGRSHVGLH